MARELTSEGRVFRNRFEPAVGAVALAASPILVLALVLSWGQLFTWMRAFVLTQAFFFTAMGWPLWSRRDWSTTLLPDSIKIVDKHGTKSIERHEIDRLESVPDSNVRIVLHDGSPVLLPAVRPSDRAELRRWLARR